MRPTFIHSIIPFNQTPSVVEAVVASYSQPPPPSALQQSLQVFALGVAGPGVRVGVVIVPPVPPAARQSPIVLKVAPVFELLLVVLQQHQRWEQAVATAAPGNRNRKQGKKNVNLIIEVCRRHL